MSIFSLNSKVGGKALPLQVDVRDEAQVQDAVEQTVSSSSFKEYIQKFLNFKGSQIRWH
jgi:NADP-dependent 3-hydroxy acid dehydrogenase YdfG